MFPEMFSFSGAREPAPARGAAAQGPGIETEAIIIQVESPLCAPALAMLAGVPPQHVVAQPDEDRASGGLGLSRYLIAVPRCFVESVWLVLADEHHVLFSQA